MKIKKEIAFIVLLGLFTFCSKNNKDSINSDLNGKWNLVQVTCFCEPINLEIGEQIWTFNLSDNELIVENNVTEPLHTIFETGNYEINIEVDKITILSVEYDYYFENGKLYLSDNPEVDGPLIEFIKD